MKHARPAGCHRRTPDNRSRRINPRQDATKQCHGKTGQRPIMPGTPAQHMHPAKRQPTCQRRIKRIDSKRQSRGGQLPVKRGNILAKLTELPVARLWLQIRFAIIQLILFINIRHRGTGMRWHDHITSMRHDENSCLLPCACSHFCSCFVLS